MSRCHLLAVVLIMGSSACATTGTLAKPTEIGCESRLRDFVTSGDHSSIARFKQGWELGWGSGWILESAAVDRIDEFVDGILLKWARIDDDVRVERLDAFTSEGCFYWAHESHLREGHEVARGGVYITRVGEPKYRALVYVSRPLPPPNSDLSKLFDTSDILYYELEAFSGGQVVSVYRSSLNIGVDSHTFEPVNVSADAQLVRGIPWPAIERARKTDTQGANSDGRHNNRLQATAGRSGVAWGRARRAPAAPEPERWVDSTHAYLGVGTLSSVTIAPRKKEHLR